MAWVLVSLIVALGLLGLTGAIAVPVGLRHWLHLLSKPADLYDPIVKARFAFHEPGHSATYELNPRHLDYYELGFKSLLEPIPSGYRFGGALKVEFLHGDRLLLERTVSTSVSATYAREDMDHLVSVALLRFPLPMEDVHEGIMLKITVLEPDAALAPFGESIELYVAVSGVP